MMRVETGQKIGIMPRFNPNYHRSGSILYGNIYQKWNESKILILTNIINRGPIDGSKRLALTSEQQAQGKRKEHALPRFFLYPHVSLYEEILVSLYAGTAGALFFARL